MAKKSAGISFGKAFNTARSNKVGNFWYGGKNYNTKLAGAPVQKLGKRSKKPFANVVKPAPATKAGKPKFRNADLPDKTSAVPQPAPRGGITLKNPSPPGVVYKHDSPSTQTADDLAKRGDAIREQTRRRAELANPPAASTKSDVPVPTPRPNRPMASRPDNVGAPSKATKPLYWGPSGGRSPEETKAALKKAGDAAKQRTADMSAKRQFARNQPPKPTKYAAAPAKPVASVQTATTVKPYGLVDARGAVKQQSVQPRVSDVAPRVPTSSREVVVGREMDQDSVGVTGDGTKTRVTAKTSRLPKQTSFKEPATARFGGDKMARKGARLGSMALDEQQSRRLARMRKVGALAYERGRSR